MKNRIFNLDLTKPLTQEQLGKLVENAKTFNLEFGKDSSDSNTSRLNFDEALHQESSILDGEVNQSEDSVVDNLTNNLLLVGDSITSTETLKDLSIYCEEVIKQCSLSPKQKFRIFCAFASIVYKIDKIYCPELHDRIQADLTVTCDTNEDFTKIVSLFSNVEAEVYSIYKYFVSDPEKFREYFLEKKHTIDRVYAALLYAGV